MKEIYPYYVKYKKHLTPVALILLGVLLFFAVIIPQISAISETSEQISQATDKRDVLENSVSVVEKANQEQTQENLQTVTTALPTSKDISLIFEALSETAGNSGVGLDEFSLSVGGLYGKAQEVETKGVIGIPVIDVKIRVSGDAQTLVNFSQQLQKSLPLSEIKLVEMSDGDANYSVSFFYKPLDLAALRKDDVAPLNQSDVNLINQLKSWEQ